MNKQSHLAYLLKVAGSEKYKLLLAVLFSAASAVAAIAPYLFLNAMLREALQPQWRLDVVLWWVKLTAALIIGRFILFMLSGICSHIAAFTILYELRLRAVRHFGGLSMGFFVGRTTAELQKTVNEDVEKLENFIAHQLPDLAAAAAAPLVILAYLLTVDYRLALLLLLPALLALLIQAVMMQDFRQRMEAYYALLNRLHSAIMEYICGMPVMKAFNLTAGSFAKYAQSAEQYAAFWRRIARKMGPAYGIFTVIIESPLLFSIPGGGWLYLNGEIDLPVYILFMTLSLGFLNSFKTLLEFGSTFSMVLEGAGKVRQLLAEPQQADGHVELSRQGRYAIEFEQVSFRYADTDVLQDVSFCVRPGETVALVGPSGAGKTTLAQLLGRFWDLEQGQIRIGGHDIRALKLASLMDQVAFVFQETFVLHDSVYENIRMGQPASREQVAAAARAAQLDDFIRSLPDGYDTRLGEQGIKLSGGQIQRMAIARAILKDAPVVVLDEATSFADIENEGRIQAALAALLRDRTVLVIAHRLYTIQHADKIIVLDNGRVAGQGTHAELLSGQPLYAHLWSLQTQSLTTEVAR
ncbi:MAG: ABC transporter ATP-binding protein [Sporomusaceae bacterium]|nr:ABC transporter ATP-binding protein [Sporomusaceae bacterium]